jgi:hypothetical protein
MPPTPPQKMKKTFKRKKMTHKSLSSQTNFNILEAKQPKNSDFQQWNIQNV